MPRHRFKDPLDEVKYRLGQFFKSRKAWGAAEAKVRYLAIRDWAFLHAIQLPSFGDEIAAKSEIPTIGKPKPFPLEDMPFDGGILDELESGDKE